MFLEQELVLLLLTAWCPDYKRLRTKWLMYKAMCETQRHNTTLLYWKIILNEDESDDEKSTSTLRTTLQSGRSQPSVALLDSLTNGTKNGVFEARAFLGWMSSS